MPLLAVGSAALVLLLVALLVVAVLPGPLVSAVRVVAAVVARVGVGVAGAVTVAPGPVLPLPAGGGRVFVLVLLVPLPPFAAPVALLVRVGAVDGGQRLRVQAAARHVRLGQLGA
ncbi:hypothetical protein ON010_g6913 [Phytophthora cinnamomi]|nr:hypothetical protein ON010_g6913 [Phytophthora cinnamomi]